MEYFEEEIKQDELKKEIPVEEVQEKVQIEEPIIEKSETLNDSSMIKPKSETIEIKGKEKVLRYVKPQEIKYHHFEFDDINKKQLTDLLQNIPGHIFTVTYGIQQNTPDILLSKENEIIGKIHLLLHDRRDIADKNKYYIKLYFYDFQDQQTYNVVKNLLVNFFENFKPIPIPKKRSPSIKKINKKRTYKKRKTNTKKITRRK